MAPLGKIIKSFIGQKKSLKWVSDFQPWMECSASMLTLQLHPLLLQLLQIETPAHFRIW